MGTRIPETTAPSVLLPLLHPGLRSRMQVGELAGTVSHPSVPHSGTLGIPLRACSFCKPPQKSSISMTSWSVSEIDVRLLKPLSPKPKRRAQRGICERPAAGEETSYWDFV